MAWIKKGVQDRILRVIYEKGGEVTINEIMESTGFKRNNTHRALELLRSRSLVKKEQRTFKKEQSLKIRRMNFYSIPPYEMKWVIKIIKEANDVSNTGRLDSTRELSD